MHHPHCRLFQMGATSGGGDGGGAQFRATSRINGWSCPPNPLQLIAWIVYFFFAAVFFGCVCPSIVWPWDVVFYSVSFSCVVGCRLLFGY